MTNDRHHGLAKFVLLGAGTVLLAGMLFVLSRLLTDDVLPGGWGLLGTLIGLCLVLWRFFARFDGPGSAVRALEFSAQGAMLLDRSGRIVWANQRFQQWIGHPLSALVGQTPDAALAACFSAPPNWDAMHEQVRQNGHFHTELPWATQIKSGPKLPVLVSIEILRLAGYFRSTAYLLHLWKDMGTSTQVPAMDQEFKSLADAVNMHAIVSVADYKGRIVEVNPAFCSISGYTREQLVGQDHRILNSGFHEVDFWIDLWSTISSGRPWRGEICNRKASGELYWVDSMIAPFMATDGTIQKYMSVRVEITGRVMAMKQLQSQAILMRSILNRVPFGLAIFDADLQVKMFNAPC